MGKAQKTDAHSSAHSKAACSAEQGSLVHHGVECDSCGLCPIRGARFHSLVSFHKYHRHQQLFWKSC